MKKENERVPLWYSKGYSLSDAFSKMLENGYSVEEAATRIVTYSRWLDKRKTEKKNEPIRKTKMS